jgi:hypothetical protein
METEEKNENLNVKDVVVLSAVSVTTIVAVGALARLGYDLAEEGIKILKAKRAQKKS